MALPTYSLQCPSGRGLTLRCSQVGAGKGLSSSSKFGGRASGLRAWRRRGHWESQRSGVLRVIAMGRKKEVGKGGENERPELKLEAADMMEIEFGRMLGDPRQATLSKVIGRKVNPDVSYIDIEKKPIRKVQSSSSSRLSEAEFTRLLNQEGRPNPRPKATVQKSTAETSENLPGLIQPPLRPGQPLPQVSRRTLSVNSAKTSPQGKKAIPLVTFGPGGFAAQTNKPRAEEDDYMDLVQKPTIPSPDSYKPSWPKNDIVPPMLIGKSKKAAEPLDDFLLRRPKPGNKGVAVESSGVVDSDDDYRGLVQKPAIPSPDSYKPSWPKNDIVPPMLIGKSKRSVEPLDETLLRRPTPGDKGVADESSGVLDSDVGSGIYEDPKVPLLTGKPSLAKPSKKLSTSPGPVLDSPPFDISAERFAQVLELAGSTKDQDVPDETSTTLADNSSTRKETPRLGPKPVLATKSPPQVDGSREGLKASLGSTAADLQTASMEESTEPMLSHTDTESGVDLRGVEENSTDMAKPDNIQSIMSLVKEASRIVSARPPKRFSQAIRDPLKAKTGDSVSSVDDRLAGWSDEVKAAVKRIEDALPSLGTRATSEPEFDQLLQRRKTELLQRPVPPSTPELSPDPIEVSSQQRYSSRPAVPSPKPPRPDAATEEADQDWARAEALRESRTVEEVVFARAVANGLQVKFGSLVGFLAAYELSSRRRPPSYTTWAQDNDFTINRKLKSSENDEMANGSEVSKGTGSTGGDDAEPERLLQLYREARSNLLSSLVGETAKVVVVAVERERKQLRFSEKQAEGEGQELAQKKAQLMTSLNVGDVVKCTVKKVTNFGAFVELQGVPALIHVSELSWNRVTDPSTVINVGQEVEVKVCRLDRYLQRINLSLKQMQPDPLRETLESLVSSDLGEAAANVGAPDDNEASEMPELVGVMKRLEAYKGIGSVQIGRRIQGTALAPTFQVYLSGQLDDGFKLLARSGNQVQEVLVQTVLDRESMKDAIRQCTFSDE